MIPSVPARICYSYSKLAGSFKVSMPHENGSKIQGNSIHLSSVCIVFYPLKPDSDWIQTFLWNLCWVELPNSVCGFKPTTRKNNSWVQTQKHQIVNCGSEPTTRKINPWVQTQIHKIVNSGFGPTLYCEQSKRNWYWSLCNYVIVLGSVEFWVWTHNTI